MRLLPALLLLAVAADPAPRLGVAPDLKTYPQSTAKETFASVVRAIENKRIEYLVAQLADPAFVDQRVKDNGGKPDELLREAKARLLDDPTALKRLRQLLTEGQWRETGDEASVLVKEQPERKAYFRKRDGRWYFENRYKDPPPTRPEP